MEVNEDWNQLLSMNTQWMFKINLTEANHVHEMHKHNMQNKYLLTQYVQLNILSNAKSPTNQHNQSYEINNLPFGWINTSGWKIYVLELHLGFTNAFSVDQTIPKLWYVS